MTLEMPNKNSKYNFNHRCWCFTSFDVEKPIYNEKKMRYLVFQPEKCPTSGKKHWQGYVEFQREVSMSSCKKYLGSNAIHVESRKGTQDQAKEYCFKSKSSEGAPIEFGKPIIQGQRTDLDSMVEMIMQGATSFEVLDEYKGNGLRHLGMIKSAIQTVWCEDRMDKHIREIRRKLPHSLHATIGDELRKKHQVEGFTLKISNSVNVAGNTNPPQ